MYKKGAALELQFSPARLNSGAGDPYWIDLSLEEARRLHGELGAYLARANERGADPLLVTLDANASTHIADANNQPPVPNGTHASSEFTQWVCVICGYVYDEATGDPEHGLPAGTRWGDVPDDWRCPLCDVGKEDFALVEF